MKVSELTGAVLDYWVARAENVPAEQLEIREIQRSSPPETHCVRKYRSIDPIIGPDLILVAPSSNWAHGGPIIEKQHIELTDERIGEDDKHSPWSAYCEGPQASTRFAGDKALIAAMRAYVASIYGDEVPDITA